MAEARERSTSDSATRVLLRVLLYYTVLLAVGGIVLTRVPQLPSPAAGAFEGLFSVLPRAEPRPPGTVQAMDEFRLAVAVAVSMLSSILLSLPVAWIYLLTRSKRGYQQSVVQLLIILPLVVAGIVVLVKYSLALAFSLAGIVAAVRFRNTLDDSKDAVYVFLATGVGLASAVNIPVAAVISILFNATVVVLWSTDFGHAPVALDGSIAERRLRQARALARTGTFVAQLDNEVFRNMTREQLEGIAERAWKRANADGSPRADEAAERTLRIVTTDSRLLRSLVEPRLDRSLREWTLTRTASGPTDGAETLEYTVRLRRKGTPEEVEALVRTVAAQGLVSVEIT